MHIWLLRLCIRIDDDASEMEGDLYILIWDARESYS